MGCVAAGRAAVLASDATIGQMARWRDKEGAGMIRMGLRAISALAIAIGVGFPAQAGPTVDKIKQAGSLTCGVPTGIPGFGMPDSQGKYSGLDVDVCRAIAAALLGDAEKVKYVPLTAIQRFPALQS